MSTDDDTVLRVICASVSLVRSSVMDEMLGMRRDVRAFNTDHDLRSALLHCSGWFFQWHEGPIASVEKMMHIADGDPRHHRPRVLHRSLGKRTLTETLQIAATHGTDKPTDVARRLFQLVKGQAVEPGAQPRELWQQIAAPLYLPPGAAHPPLVRQHVVAVTSEFTGAVDLVRTLGERFDLPVTYQRFANDEPRSTDVGAAYIDLPGEGQVTRLHALSRRSLAHPMVRMMLSELNCVVLMLGERVEAARVLARDVGQMLQSLAVRPALRLVPGGEETLLHARQALQGSTSDMAEIDLSVLCESGPDAVFRSLMGACDPLVPEKVPFPV
jgi:hypothetical protein